MAWYRTGTISVTNGSATVTGSGTSWVANVSAGEAIYLPDGKFYEIQTVDSATQITLVSAYTGTSLSGQTYKVMPTQSFIHDLANQASDLLNTYSTIASAAGAGKFGDGTVSAPGIAFSSDTNSGIYRVSDGVYSLVSNGVVVATINGTTFQTSGNVTLGDATTDSAKISGYLGIGGNAATSTAAYVRNTALVGTSQFGVVVDITSASDATASSVGVVSKVSTAAASYTAANVFAFYADDTTKGAGSTISSQYGLYINDQTQGTNNYGIFSGVSSGTNKYNIYASGTAQNYFAGSVGIGNSTPVYKLQVGGSNQSVGTDLINTNSTAHVFRGTPDSIGWHHAKVLHGRDTSPWTYGSYLAFYTEGKNSGTTDTSVERMRIDSSGNVIVTSSGGLGYGTGSGGTVTQGTSRTTGVTLNKTNGAITLVSAAGSATWQSFTLTNSTIAATDTVRVCQKSGTDLYQIHVTAVAAGSCQITYATTGGTTTEQPVFNFAVLKGVTS